MKEQDVKLAMTKGCHCEDTFILAFSNLGFFTLSPKHRFSDTPLLRYAYVYHSHSKPQLIGNGLHALQA